MITPQKKIVASRPSGTGTPSDPKAGDYSESARRSASPETGNDLPTKLDTSILVVDDAKFPCALICRLLRQAGFEDIREASSASEALQAHQERPSDILLADWMMPDMNGLQLTERVRADDQNHNRYTYIILVTSREAQGVHLEAFEHGVDDFISKSDLQEQLAPRIRSGLRLCQQMKALYHEQHLLLEELEVSRQGSLIDPLTGLGNQRYLQLTLDRFVSQLETRGGALSCLIFRLRLPKSSDGSPALRDPAEIIKEAAQRLEQRVRPLDMLFRMEGPEFIGLFLSLESSSGNEFRPSTFKRLHECLNIKPFQLREGFFNISADISMLVITPDNLPTSLDQVLHQARELLALSAATQRIAPGHLRTPEPD